MFTFWKYKTEQELEIIAFFAKFTLELQIFHGFGTNFGKIFETSLNFDTIVDLHVENFLQILKSTKVQQNYAYM